MIGFSKNFRDRTIVATVLVACTLVISIFLFPLATYVYGQKTNEVGSKGINITLSPVFINLSIEAGKSKKHSFKVTNNNPFPENYLVSVIKYVPDKSGNIVPSDDLSPDDPTARWFNFDNERFVVDAQTTKIINFEITPAEDAFLGYYFGLMIKRVNQDVNGLSGTAKLIGAPAIPVLLEVTQNIDGKTVNVDADISKYKIGSMVEFKSTRTWYESLPTQFEVTFRNSGRVHIAPFGDIFITQGKGGEIASIQINDGLANVLPNSQRKFTSSWDDGFIVYEPIKLEDGSFKKSSDGQTVSEMRIHWDKLTKLRVGRYKAHAVLVYNDGKVDVPLESTIYFWIFPWKIILIITIVISLVFLGIKNTFFGPFRR
jgi:hypothetical protein